MNTHEVARLTGVSVRTLHHYDSIGLLVPGRNSENDYRDYSDDDLDKLKQILIFKECGFRLGQIKTMLEKENFNQLSAFLLQKDILLHEEKRIRSMLSALDTAINYYERGEKMSNQEKFNGFDFSQNPYEEEARKLWGDKAVDESTEHLNKLDKSQQAQISANMDTLFSELAQLRQEDPGSEAAQEGIDKLFKFFNTGFGYQYSYEAFAGLGQLYITDERFTKNIDGYGVGLSRFLAEGMEIYAKKHA